MSSPCDPGDEGFPRSVPRSTSPVVGRNDRSKYISASSSISARSQPASQVSGCRSWQTEPIARDNARAKSPHGSVGSKRSRDHEHVEAASKIQTNIEVEMNEEMTSEANGESKESQEVYSARPSIEDITWKTELKDIRMINLRLEVKLDELKNLIMVQSSPMGLTRSATNATLMQTHPKKPKAMPRSATLNTLGSESSVMSFATIMARAPRKNSIRHMGTDDRAYHSSSPSPLVNSIESVASTVHKMEHTPQDSLASTKSIRDRMKAASAKMRNLAVESSVRKRKSGMITALTCCNFEVSYVLELIWNLLEEPESSRCAQWLAALMPWFIIFTVFVTLFQSVKSAGFHGVNAAVLETTIDSIFLLEFLLRFLSCPNHFSFLFNVYNYIDLAAAAPLVPRFFAGLVLSDFEVTDVLTCFLFCVVPMIRLLKLLRRFEKFHLLLNAFKLAFEALPVLVFILTAIALLFSMLIFLVEPSDNIGSWPLAAWMTIVTMATVGYGDYTPRTSAGMIITGVLIVVTVMYMAIPLGIVGNAFTETWKDRDRILLMQRTRDRLKQWGYTAHDIPTLFHLSDDNGDCKLTLDEFTRLIKQMQLGFSEARILQLFQLFDQDGNGTVDDSEFVQTLFPHSYHEIYLAQRSEGETARGNDAPLHAINDTDE